MSDTQSAASHAKFVPMYHYVGFASLLIPTVYFVYTAVTSFSVGALMMVLFGFGVIVNALFARLFPLGVQDRVIRLEERTRLQGVLPSDMHGRINEISTDHLIGMRFASDAELAELAGRVLGGDLKNRKSIKEAVKNWRADHQRI